MAQLVSLWGLSKENKASSKVRREINNFAFIAKHAVGEREIARLRVGL